VSAGCCGCEGRPSHGGADLSSCAIAAQHYLLTLLLPLIQQPSPNNLTPRVVLTSSSLQTTIKSAGEAEPLLRHPPSGNDHDRYSASKFAQVCAALGWQEKLGDEVEVVLVSPGE
jgi:hypothetical protein